MNSGSFTKLQVSSSRGAVCRPVTVTVNSRLLLRAVNGHSRSFTVPGEGSYDLCGQASRFHIYLLFRKACVA